MLRLTVSAMAGDYLRLHDFRAVLAIAIKARPFTRYSSGQAHSWLLVGYEYPIPIGPQMVRWTGFVHKVQVCQTRLSVEIEVVNENSIVHIGPFEKDRDMYLPKLREKMRTKFPRARCTYWQTYVFDPPFEEEDYSLMQQAKDLLKELRREMLWGDSPHKDKPIVFICWGMSGGILLKQVCPRDTIIFLGSLTNTHQMILLLKEHIENNVNDWYDQADTSENLYENVSAVVLFGCAHDERPDNFSDRTLWSLIFEAGDDILNTQESMVTWKPVLDWFTSTTAEFRNLSLRFPVHTYYEMCQTRLSGLYGGPIQISEIVGNI